MLLGLTVVQAAKWQGSRDRKKYLTKWSASHQGLTLHFDFRGTSANHTMLEMLAPMSQLKVPDKSFAVSVPAAHVMAVSDTLFREAANSIPIGFVMFDAQERIVVANSTFLEIYDLTETIVHPGTTLAELLRARFAETGMSEALLAEKVAFVRDLVARMEPHTRVDTLPDGKRINVVHRPLEGGGWVGTHEDVTERETAAERLRYLAHHDALTGVKSRAYFWEFLNDQIAAARNGQLAVAMHLIDLDHFKPVNDSYGHEAGDTVLREVAHRLEKVVRRVDVVARIGGDEFAIVQCDDKLSRWDAERVASRVVEALSKDIGLSEGAVRVGASLGVAIYDDRTSDAATLVRLADEAMYRAKHNGRNGYLIA